jgi:drug/metabolite transporter (DMT)-like permease
MNWIVLAVIAQFLNALVAVLDKQIVSDEKMLPKPFVYAFYTCLIAGIWIVVYLVSLLPISLEWLHVPTFANVHSPTLEVVALAYLAAYTFFMALVSMFTALQKGNASDVVPVIGATSAIASFALGYFFLDGAMSENFALGIIILAIGTFLVSRFNFDVRTALLAIHAGVYFAFHYVVIKGLFLVTNFDDAFFWSRVAFMLFAISLLMIPSYYNKIKEQTQSTTKKAGAYIFANKVLAGISTILILKATDWGDVAVVQALGGLQYVFILLLGLFFTFAPTKPIAGEVYKKESILQKALFVTVIAVGFLVLFK